MGLWSDKVGRKKILLLSSAATSVLMLVFLNVQGWLIVPLLLALGFIGFSVMPVMLAIVQEQFPNHRATANGLYMMVIFLLRPVGTLVVGMLGDRFGLHNGFLIATGLSILTLPAILAMPENRPG